MLSSSRDTREGAAPAGRRQQIPLKALLFDLDGTLVDSRQDIASCINHTLAELGRPPLSVEDVSRMVGEGVSQLLVRVLGTTDGPTIKTAIDLFLPYYLEHCVDATRPYPGVVETLKGWSGKGLAVVTNKPLAHTMRTLDRLGLRAHFPVVVGGDSLLKRKPDPEPLWEALRQLGVSKEEAAMVGDSPVDIEAGRAAGVKVLAVGYGFRSKEELRKLGPDVLVDAFAELREVVQ